MSKKNITLASVSPSGKTFMTTKGKVISKNTLLFLINFNLAKVATISGGQVFKHKTKVATVNHDEDGYIRTLPNKKESDNISSLQVNSKLGIIEKKRKKYLIGVACGLLGGVVVLAPTTTYLADGCRGETPIPPGPSTKIDISDYITSTILNEITNNQEATIKTAIIAKNSATSSWDWNQLSFSSVTNISATLSAKPGSASYTGTVNVEFTLTPLPPPSELTKLADIISITNLGRLSSDNRTTVLNKLSELNPGANLQLGELTMSINNVTDTDSTRTIQAIIGVIPNSQVYDEEAIMITFTVDISQSIPLSSVLTATNVKLSSNTADDKELLRVIGDANPEVEISAVQISQRQESDGEGTATVSPAASSTVYSGDVTVTYPVKVNLANYLPNVDLGYLPINVPLHELRETILRINSVPSLPWEELNLDFRSNGTCILAANKESLIYYGEQHFIYEYEGELSEIINETDLGVVLDVSEQGIKTAIENVNKCTLNWGAINFEYDTNSATLTALSHSEYRGSVTVLFVQTADLGMLIQNADIGYVSMNDALTIIERTCFANELLGWEEHLDVTGIGTASATIIPLAGDETFYGSAQVTYMISNDIGLLTDVSDLGVIESPDIPVIQAAFDHANPFANLEWAHLKIENITGTSATVLPDDGDDKYVGSVAVTFFSNVDDTKLRIEGTTLYGFIDGYSALPGIELSTPSGIVTIAPDAFNATIVESSPENIGSLKFEGDTVEAIKSSSFKGCVGISGPVEFPSTLSQLEDNAFDGCTGITAIDLSRCTQLTSSGIGDGVFNNCSSINTVELPSSLTSIPNDIFTGCTGITSLTLPANSFIAYDDQFADSPISQGNGVVYVSASYLPQYESQWPADFVFEAIGTAELSILLPVTELGIIPSADENIIIQRIEQLNHSTSGRIVWGDISTSLTSENSFTITALETSVYYQGTVTFNFIVPTVLDTVIKKTDLGWLLGINLDDEIEQALLVENPDLFINEVYITNIGLNSALAVAADGSVVYQGTVEITFRIREDIGGWENSLDTIVDNTDQSIIAKFMQINDCSSSFTEYFSVGNKTLSTATIYFSTDGPNYRGSNDVTFSLPASLTSLVTTTAIGNISEATPEQVLANTRTANPLFNIPISGLNFSFISATECKISAVPGSLLCSGSVSVTFVVTSTIPENCLRIQSVWNPETYSWYNLLLGFISGYSVPDNAILVVPSRVTEVDYNAFQNNSKLIKVVFESTTTLRLRESAFENCSNLSTLEFSATIDKYEIVARSGSLSNLPTNGVVISHANPSTGNAAIILQRLQGAGGLGQNWTSIYA